MECPLIRWIIYLPRARSRALLAVRERSIVEILMNSLVDVGETGKKKFRRPLSSDRKCFMKILFVRESTVKLVE
jgi:hypothetical protein